MNTIPRADIASAIPALIGIGLIIAGVAVMVGAVRQRSTPASLLGLIIIAGGVVLVVLDR